MRLAFVEKCLAGSRLQNLPVFFLLLLFKIHSRSFESTVP